MAKQEKYSYSRFSLFENCPCAYCFRYEQKAKPMPEDGASPRRVGSAAHSVAEDMVRNHVRDGARGALALDEVPGLLRKHWAKQELPGDSRWFADALGWLRRWAVEESPLDFRSVLGVEKRFDIVIEGVHVLGFIDRVSKVDRDTIEVIDYKTGAALFDRSELDHGLQLSIYAIAARELFPKFENVRLVYSMLRHGVRQIATRTPEQLEATGHYLAALVSVIRSCKKSGKWPAKVNANCGFCDYRDRCDAYREALETVTSSAPLVTVEEACRERVAMHALERAASKRKREAEAVIKVALKQRPELRAAGAVWSYYEQARTDYDARAVLAALADASGLDVGEIAARVCKITKSALTEFVDGLELDTGESMALLAELDVLGEVKVSPRLNMRSGRKA